MEPFIGQIMMFAGNFAPRGWAFCDGQLLPVRNYAALFSIIGITYGGDGRTSFALPDLRGRVPIHAGQGAKLTIKRLGEKSGDEKVTLSVNEMPKHLHKGTGSVSVSNQEADDSNPTGKVLSIPTNGVKAYSDSPSASMKEGCVQMNIENTGGSMPHSNMQPYQVVNFIIALEGIYPSRS